MTNGPIPTLTDGFTALAAHVLAHVPLDQPGNLHDPRYVDWSRARFDRDTQALLEHDGALIGAHWRARRELDVIHGLFELHRDLDGFRRTATRPLADLEAHEVASPTLLARLRGEPMSELLHTSLALVDRELERVMLSIEESLDEACCDLTHWCARVAACVPTFSRARIELVWALGLHGRALPDRILIGAPAAWSRCSPARQAVLAAHEHMVARSGAADYLTQEWSALTKLARALADADDVELACAHAEFLAQLDLDELLTGAQQRGFIDADTATALRREPLSRARRLATYSSSPCCSTTASSRTTVP